MATCTLCGERVSLWQRDLFTGVCPKCRRVKRDPQGKALAAGSANSGCTNCGHPASDQYYFKASFSSSSTQDHGSYTVTTYRESIYQPVYKSRVCDKCINRRIARNIAYLIALWIIAVVLCYHSWGFTELITTGIYKNDMDRGFARVAFTGILYFFALVGAAAISYEFLPVSREYAGAMVAYLANRGMLVREGHNTFKYLPQSTQHYNKEI